jgi:hypothetical protein
MFSSDDSFGPIEHDFTCWLCKTAVLGRGRYRDLHQYWCQECLKKEQTEVINNKPKPMLWREVPRQKHDEVIAESLGGDSSHPRWCRCGWCKPLVIKPKDDATQGGT